jgi:hypothetical protein
MTQPVAVDGGVVVVLRLERRVRQNHPVNEDEVTAWEEIHRGHRGLTWDLWSAPIGYSTALSPRGQRVMQEAVASIADFLGEDWLERFLRPRSAAGNDDHLPLMSFSWWPGNGASHVYVRLLAFAARIRLFAGAEGIAQVRRAMRSDVGHFAHAHLQLEVGALALRDGWHVRFEPKVDSRQHGRADVALTRAGEAMLVETKGFRLDKHTAADLKFTDLIHNRVLALEMTEQVSFSGELGIGDDLTELEGWLQNLSTAARRVSQTGVPAELDAPFGGTMHVRPGRPPERSGYSLPIRRGDEWLRLRAAIRSKADQGRSDLPLWLRFDETSEFWNLSAPPGPAHVHWLAELARQVQLVMADFDNLAGLVLSGLPGASTAHDVEMGLLGSRAVLMGRRTGPAFWRESLLIPASQNASAEQLLYWLNWYRDEHSWLAWALQQLDLPPLEELFADRAL